MTFLAPFALIGMLLLLIPVVVHLFKPRKMKQTPFSSLRWLKQTHQRLSRRIQWHQWLFFLLRAGCILVLVLALAKPLIGNWGASGHATDRIVILDASRSMAYKLGELPSARERATELAERFVQTSLPGDRTALVLADSRPRLIAPLLADATPHLATLKAGASGQADCTLSAALPLVRSLLARQNERSAELVFLTDNLKTRWQQNDVQTFLKDLSTPVNVKVVEVGPGSAYNAWITTARLLPFGPDEERWLRVEVGCVGESSSARSIRLAGLNGISDDVQEIALKPGQISRVDFKIPAALSLANQVAEFRLEPADGLPSDDTYYLNLDSSSALRVLVVEPEAEGSDGRPVGLHLRAGMEALAASKNQWLKVTTRPATTVSAGDFQTADVIFLAGVPELTDAALENLETRVRAGAGLAIFLGPQLNTTFYNQKLHRQIQPAEGLLPLPLKLARTGYQSDGNPGTLTHIRWTNPLLAALNDPVLSDLTQTKFRYYGSLDGEPAKNDTVLARIDDAAPALIEHPFGAGRVLILNTSANTEWSDLPRRKSFIPLLDRMLTYLSAGGAQHRYIVGEAVSLPWTEGEASTLTVLAPSGTKLMPRVISKRGLTLLHFDDVPEAGVYQIEGATKKNFVVNASRTDSPLNPMDARALETWWAPSKIEVLSAETFAQHLDQQSSHWPLWPMLIACAGLLLLAETIYVHRLCPRTNARVADAVVPQRGVMRPVAGKVEIDVFSIAACGLAPARTWPALSRKRRNPVFVFARYQTKS